MRRVVDALRVHHFTERGCAARLGVDPLLGIRFFGADQGRFGAMAAGAARTLGREQRVLFDWSASADPLDVLIGLFIAGEAVALQRLEGIFTARELDALQQMGLVDLDAGHARCALQLYPARGRYFATDRPQPVPRGRPVMPLLPESYFLAHCVDREQPIPRALDLCTGCGVHALLAAEHSEQVLAVDINPRAIAFATFNAALGGGGGNVRFEIGDLYGPCEADARFDLVVSNPPYVPSPDHEAGANWFSGGPSGEEILGRIVSGLPTVLARGGLAHLYTMLVHHEGVAYRDKLETWLGGLDGWDVAIRAVSIPYVASSGPSTAASRFEIGLISLRRNDGSHPPVYYHGPDLLPFFGNAGVGRATLGYDSFDCRW